MKFSPTILLPSILTRMVQCSRTPTSKCVELNFQAAALQSSDSCAIFNTAINSGDVLAGDTTDIDRTCGVYPQTVYRRSRDCVEEVVNVVAGITDEGCEVTGGVTVANFIYTVNDLHEGFSSLHELVCKGGECYTNIQKTIEYCNDSYMDESCIRYLSCECLDDFLEVIETLGSSDESFIKVHAEIIDKIRISGTTCRCEDLNSRAGSFEIAPSCSLSSRILEAGNIFSAATATLAQTCNKTETSCVEDVVSFVETFTEYGCGLVYSYSDVPLIDRLEVSSDDFNIITDFACNNGPCYSALRACQNDNYSCIGSISCSCMFDFLAFLDDLSPEARQELIKLDTSIIGKMRQSVGECLCEELNDKAATVQMKGYCALQTLIVEEGYIFAGNSNDIQSTCAEPHACVDRVTKAISQISDEGCEFKQSSDFLAKFLYNINNSTDFSEMTRFICLSGCYDEVKAVVQACEVDVNKNCTESARSDCLIAFVDMVERLLEDTREDFLGIDSDLISMIDPRDEPQDPALLNNETSSTNDTTTPTDTQPEMPSSVAPVFLTWRWFWHLIIFYLGISY